MKEYKMVGDLQRPNSSLILTTGKLPLAVKEALIKFFFEEVKLARFVFHLNLILSLFELFYFRLNTFFY